MTVKEEKGPGLLSTAKTETAYVCPDCGSPLVEFSFLAGGNGTCKACKWMGPKDKLLSVPLTNTFGSSDEVFASMRNNLRSVVSQSSVEYVRFLVKWGFVEAVQRGGKIEVTNHKQVVRYVNAIAQAVFMAILNERQKIEVERVNGG